MQKESGHAEYDVLVVGGGIAGQEAALNMGSMGYQVLLVEKDLSMGGKMLQLSKVFPTLDCAACIATPKVSETARHPNITIFTNSEMKDLSREENGSFSGILVKSPRYIDEHACTGCQDCEEACPVIVRDQYQYNLVGRKAAYIPFSIASPRVAAIDIDNCILCGACERACPADAVDFRQEKEEMPVRVKTVIIATGFRLFDPTVIERYNYRKLRNVITSMQMERQLVPTRPYNNVLRPGDGKMPDNIAYLLCTGSRDETLGNPICSQVCCMYSIKQAQLVLGALPMADVTIYYIDIRAFGKGFEEFYRQTFDMGVEFVKGKVAEIDGEEDGDLILKYEDVETSTIKEARHDMVVLSVGILANRDPENLFTGGELDIDEYGYVRQPAQLSSPASTSMEGVFVAGTASAPMDIPDSISSAGAAAAEAAGYLRKGMMK
ncbi:MAG: 4Fe-4S dicluster domain-containing protein [Candidatus Latescibacteria bacterium]|nr:4Fe-4S dicluster domain-containing protein [bacterium]MBD3423247.1 4Fe-4S dicluster domain-containing protein [Candidatus Latescibacterota bacterium]